MSVDHTIDQLADDAIALLKELIATPSFSKEEDRTADILFRYLKGKSIDVHRLQNNVWAKNRYFDPNLPTILLNSHHDTVKPNSGYTRDPFIPSEEDGKLFGLGSNDAGGALASLISTFLFFHDHPSMRYNLVVAITAEEEISGQNGIQSLLPHLPSFDLAIVGEPTGMQMAVAEKGLMVLDCVSKGTSGHAAYASPNNAIYNALKDLQWFQTYKFPQISPTLGEIRMNVTQIKSGSQHNVIPDRCEFIVDVRTTDVLDNEQVLNIIKKNVGCEVKARSLRLNPSSIRIDHAFVKAGIELGLKTYGSPTISDQALIPGETVKIGPGESPRSHMSDEFIYTSEIRNGIYMFNKLFSKILR